MPNNMENATLDFIQKNKLIETNDNVIVALSGGADSISLLHILWRLREKLHIANILALHVNHGIRGEEAVRDELFCDKICKKWSIPLRIVQIDAKRAASSEHKTLEQVSRELRYAALEEYANEMNAKIATAHTMSDNTETVLLHLTRGTGLLGLTGIHSKEGNVIRPLLFANREEIEEYCENNHLEYVHDSTNDDIYYSRNRVRKQIIPELKELNVNLDKSVGRMTTSLKEDEAYLSSIAETLLHEAENTPGVYEKRILCNAKKPIRIRALRMLIPSSINVEFKHYMELDRLLFDEGAVTIPGGVIIKSTDRIISVFSKEVDYPFFKELVGESSCFNVDNETYVSRLYSIEDFNNLINVNNLFFNFCFDYDTIQGKLYMRQRMPGDCYHPVCRNQKSLKKLFNESSVPIEDRSKTPVLEDENGIVMTYGFGCDDRNKITEHTKRVMVFIKKSLLPDGGK